MDRVPSNSLQTVPWPYGPCWAALGIGAILLLLGPDYGRVWANPSSTADFDLVQHVRPVRVLIADSTRLKIDSSGPVFVSIAPGVEPLHRYALLKDAVITPSSTGRVELSDRDYPGSGLLLYPERNGTIRLAQVTAGGWSAALEYAGALRISINRAGRLDVVNEVEIEEYVASVTASEVWPTFHQESLRAQAVIARTYALFQMSRRPNAEVDLTATQGSQVYRGVRRDEVGLRAREAAGFTRGIVLTYRDPAGTESLFCTYYSAACGGSSQPAAVLGPESNVPPLSGNVACDFCRIAPGDTYRWGPVSFTVSDFLNRLALRYPDAAGLTGLTTIEVVEASANGRPVTWRLRGPGGQSRDILAERLRLALDGSLVRSTDCKIRLTGDQVIFEEGKGFGHGLGLCQWGMEGQAQRGRRAGEILTFYYPGAMLTRAY